MIFSLEALNAKHGDCLILHFGTRADPHYILVDGGPAGVYRASLDPRLQQLAAREPDLALELDLVLVSHLDDDHIRGIIDLAAELIEQKERRLPLERFIAGIWHNSFDDIVGSGGPAVLNVEALGRAIGGEAALLPQHVEGVVASVPQGRRLRDQSQKLAWQPNRPFRGLVTRETGGTREVPFAGGLTLTALGPDPARVAALQKEWDEVIRAQGLAAPAGGQIAALLDRSVFNLASIVVLARAGDSTMLLTGDARADDIVAGLEAAGLLTATAPFHADVLKLPHHGSSNNVDDAFFSRVTADHYVISADGKHDNPDIETLRLLTAARGADAYTLYFTNHDGANDLRARLDRFFRADRRANQRSYRVRYRSAKALSISVHLGTQRSF